MTQSLPDIYSDNRLVLSYELFPPKTEAGMADLEANLGPLLEFSPHFITCTYGAGGGTRDKTLATLAEVRSHYAGPLASHLTCVGMTVGGIREFLGQAQAQGIDFIVALRGDKPENEDPTPGRLNYANELVALIRDEFPEFGLIVGGYPEVHPEAPSAEADLDNLKRKVHAGADVIVTQLYYDNADFFRFRDRCESAGIAVPIVPGLMPVNAYSQIKRITSLCGAKLPQEFVAQLESLADDPEGQFEAGVGQATHQAAELIKAGVPGLHFYVLNKCRATIRVLAALGLRP